MVKERAEHGEVDNEKTAKKMPAANRELIAPAAARAVFR